MPSVTVAVPLRTERDPGWIYRRSWDLTFLIFSAILVPAPLLLAELAGRSGLLSERQAVDLVNLLVAGLIGGPHLLTTFTMTYLHRPFLRRHPVYAASSVLIPAGVIYLGLFHYPTLVFFFFAWASIHIFHQLIYLSDCYRMRVGHPDSAASRFIDYGVITTGLYPIGLDKMAQGRFVVGDVTLQLPEFTRGWPLPEIAGVFFFTCLAAWVLKSLWEASQGRLNIPKTLLIGITAVVSYLLPLGTNLDIAFQGYNTWHSFQYLFLFWMINRLRLERGEVENPLVRRLCGGRSIVPYYLFFLGASAVALVLTVVVRTVTNLGSDQSYFIVVLSVLLIHYYFDHFLFTKTEMVR